MKVIFLFFMYAGICFWSIAQKNDTIPKTGNTIPMDINNKTITVHINEKSDQLLLTIEELKKINKKEIVLYNPNLKKDTTILANNQKQVTISLNLDTVSFGCLMLLNVPAKIIFTIPKYNPDDKPTIGLKLLEKHVKVKSTQKQLLIENINPNNLHPKCGGGQPSDDICRLFREVRFVVCSTDPTVTQKKSTIQNNLLLKNSCNNYTEDNNIPPQKAINRVANGVTIRYFENNDVSTAQKIKAVIEKSLPNEAVHVENMTPYFKNPIPQYLEIWIK